MKSLDRKVIKKDLVYFEIKNSILNNEFTTDTPLTELLLCNRFGCSRTPVREALQRLQGDGFIKYVKGAGFFISEIGLEDVLQIYEMREALEGMGARLCTMRSNDSIISELDLLLENTIICCQQKKVTQALEFDMKFHRCIMHASQNERIEKSVVSLLELTNRILLKVDLSIVNQSIEDHKKLLKAIKSSDNDLAEKMMREHIANSKRYHFNRYYLGSNTI